MLIINGKISEEETIVADRGYYFGYGVFETILVKNNKPVLLDKHLSRLNNSMKLIGINNLVSKEEVLSALNSIIESEYALKINVSEKNKIFSTRQIPYKKEDYIKGFKLKISSITRNPQSHITYIKSMNYLDNMIEREQAIKEGFQEVVFLNNKGAVSECSTSNIFFIKEGKIRTPHIKTGLLNGIVRQWVLHNYQVEEGSFTLRDILEAEGVFLTNSLIGIMKVSFIDKTEIKSSMIINDIQKNYINFLEEVTNE